jgi:hypothetical protein
VKRIKLEYDEIGSCMREVMEVWDLLVSKESRVSTQCDSKMLLQAIRQGEMSYYSIVAGNRDRTSLPCMRIQVFNCSE